MILPSFGQVWAPACAALNMTMSSCMVHKMRGPTSSRIASVSCISTMRFSSHCHIMPTWLAPLPPVVPGDDMGGGLVLRLPEGSGMAGNWVRLPAMDTLGLPNTESRGSWGLT